MAYLGKSALRASNIKRWTGTPANNATEITFSTLGFTPLNEQSTHISINGVVQHDSAYTLSATAIVFTDSFDGVDEVEVTGILSVGQPIVPADNSVALIHLSPSLEATINSHLPNTGGSLTGNLDITGNLIISGTVDGIDVSARDAILTSTTTTANAALPKSGGAMTGNLGHADNIKSKFGANDDLEIYHENTNHHSYIWEKGSGDLYLRGTEVRIKSNVDNDDMATFIENGAANLFYSNSKKIETTATGVSISGVCAATSFTGDGSTLSNVGVDGIVSTANATAITIDSNENVGIGTASPQNLLHVQSGDSANDNYRTGGDSPLIVEGTTASYIQFVADANAPMGILMGDTSDSAVGGVTYDANGGGIRLKSGGSNRVYVSTAGFVGIGNTNPQESLDLQGAMRNIRVHNGSRVQASSSNNAIYFDNNLLKFYTGGSERVRVDNDGIKFHGDTAQANALDDYEEGTWTPGFMLGSPSYNTIYSRSGVYTKIGNVCTIWMELYAGSISFGDSTQQIRIGPLPFNSGPTGQTFGQACGSHVQVHNFYTNGSTYNTLGVHNNEILQIQPHLITNVNYFTLRISASDNIAMGEFKNACFHNGSGLVIGMTYRTY